MAANEFMAPDECVDELFCDLDDTCSQTSQRLEFESPLEQTGEECWEKRRALWCRVVDTDPEGRDIVMKKKQLDAYLKEKALEKSLLKRGVFREAYYLVYDQLVLQNRSLKEPVNLKEIMSVLEAGWALNDRRAYR